MKDINKEFEYGTAESHAVSRHLRRREATGQVVSPIQTNDMFMLDSGNALSDGDHRSK